MKVEEDERVNFHPKPNSDPNPRQNLNRNDALRSERNIYWALKLPET